VFPFPSKRDGGALFSVGRQSPVWLSGSQGNVGGVSWPALTGGHSYKPWRCRKEARPLGSVREEKDVGCVDVELAAPAARARTCSRSQGKVAGIPPVYDVLAQETGPGCRVREWGLTNALGSGMYSDDRGGSCKKPRRWTGRKRKGK